MSNLYTVEVNGIATLTFCDQLHLHAVREHFDNWDDNRIRMLLEDNSRPDRPDRPFAESGEVTFRPASGSQIARWAATVCNTITFLGPHLQIDWKNKHNQLGLQ